MDTFTFNALYEFFCFKNYCSVMMHGTNIIKHMDMAQVTLNKSVQYLDLALDPCRRNWKKNMEFNIMKRLSLTCAEYFAAESEIPPRCSIGEMFQRVDSKANVELRVIESNRHIHVEECYRRFTSVFFTRFESLDQSQKRSNCRSLLKIHRILQIKHFHNNGLKSLILEATCPEPDPELTVEILSVICVTPFLKLRCFYDTPHGPLKTMVSNAKIMGFDFWGLWRGVGNMSTKYNLIAGLMTCDRKLHAIILLQHGFPYLCSFNIYESQCTRFLESITKAKVYFTPNCYNELMAKHKRKRMMLILITYIVVSELVEEETLPDDTVATLKCLMRSLPDPYVLPSEMCNELKPYFTPASSKHIESVCRKYQELNIFSDDYTVYKPRNLEHLCRCAIRSVLAGYWRLPEGIYQLGMPSRIIKYLSLDS